MPFFSANISDGYMFGKKPIQDRIASCRSMELEAIEINNPYNVSPSHLSALLQNDETGESLQLVCMDSYNGPIDAPISCYEEKDINDFYNNNENEYALDVSDTTSVATTTQASLAYLNSDHKLFPRSGLDGYASIPGLLYAFNNCISTTLTYASIMAVPCVNVLPGTIDNSNPLHVQIFRDIQASVQVLYINYNDTEYHDESCGHNSTSSKLCKEPQIEPIPEASTPMMARSGSGLPTPSPTSKQTLCCPPHAMVVSFKLPLYLTSSLSVPTATPTVTTILPLPHVQTMSSITPTTEHPFNNNNDINSTESPLTPTTPAPVSSISSSISTGLANPITCPKLAKYYQYLSKTQHNNNKSYFLMKRLLPSQFIRDNQHALFETFFHSCYLPELVDLYSAHYTDIISKKEQPTPVNNGASVTTDLKLSIPQEDSKSKNLYSSPQHATSGSSLLEKDDEKKDDKEKDRKSKSTITSYPSKFSSLSFPTHNAYNNDKQNKEPSLSSTDPTSTPTAANIAPSGTKEDKKSTSSSSSQPTFDTSSPYSDYLLTSLIFTTLVFNLKLIARHASRNDQLRDNLSLMLGLSGSTYVTTIFRLLRILVFCSSDNIGILYDVPTVYQQHGNIITLFEKLSPLIRHIRVGNQHTELDNTILFNAIHQKNYTGWVCLDFCLQNATIPTKKLLQPWFSHYLRRRNGSAGVLFMCRGKQGKVYVLLGKETKHGQKAVGPFWGRPDKTDIDIEMTAVRETIEESLGCVVSNPTVLYSALKNKGFFYKCPRINLFVVNIGTLGVKERTDVVARYSWLRQTYFTNNIINDSNLGGKNQPPSPIPVDPYLLAANSNNSLNKSLFEMEDVVWVDLYDMYRHYMLKSYRLLVDYGIVIQNQTVRDDSDDDEKDNDAKKGGKKDKDGKKDKKKKKDNDDAEEKPERETIALSPPHNNEHTITSIVNTIQQQRTNYNNLPLRRFFVREMIYMWLTDPQWLALVHKRDFTIHSVERLIELHAQQVEKQKAAAAQEIATKHSTKQTQQQSVKHEDDVDHKQWRSAPL